MPRNILTKGNIGKYLESAIRNQATIDRVVTSAMRATASGLKARCRNQIAADTRCQAPALAHRGLSGKVRRGLHADQV